jgi:hypothetical protein
MRRRATKSDSGSFAGVNVASSCCVVTLAKEAPERLGDEITHRKPTRGSVLLQLGVSDHSKAYVAVSREIVAQLEAHKALILFDN